MENPDRLARIRGILTEAFAPQTLEVGDESARHAGHAGHVPGEITHVRVRLVAQAFEGEGRVARQRRVNQALAPEFARGLHALALSVETPQEAARR